MNTSSLKYTSFLVRLWRESVIGIEASPDGGSWLVQVEHIPKGEKFYFASIEALFAYIQEQTAGSANAQSICKTE